MKTFCNQLIFIEVGYLKHYFLEKYYYTFLLLNYQSYNWNLKKYIYDCIINILQFTGINFNRNGNPTLYCDKKEKKEKGRSFMSIKSWYFSLDKKIWIKQDVSITVQRSLSKSFVVLKLNQKKKKLPLVFKKISQLITIKQIQVFVFRKSYLLYS